MVLTPPQDKRPSQARRLTRAALLTAIALTIFLAEAQLPPPVPIPGIKLGLANIVTVYAMFVLGTGKAGFLQDLGGSRPDPGAAGGERADRAVLALPLSKWADPHRPAAAAGGGRPRAAWAAGTVVRGGGERDPLPVV